jgi:hypothetical protein
MSSLPEKIEVVCAKCGEIFDQWLQPPADPAAAAICPHCGYDLSGDQSIWQDGAWEPPADDLEPTDR